jgi:photosystem II stability/assembly factor-like uncharacterized protein
VALKFEIPGRLIAGLCLSVSLACCQAVIDATALNGFEWRSLGPAVMGGRISDLDGVPGDPSVVFAAAGSGGLFRTRNGGLTWDSLFDRQSTISIGAIAVQPDNRSVIWVGTGESNVRNSVSFGDGVYKSEDGGATWKNVGLEQTQTISRIIIDPKNPDNVFVAAVGHTFGPNTERGVFVTRDGGRTWQKTLYIDANHGASDLDMDPADSSILYAGMWHFDRKPWTYISGSEQGGIFKSTDGGTTWRKVTAGLPRLMGRIGIKVAPSHPEIVYAITESKEGTLYRSNDRGATFEKLSSDRELVGRAYYFSDLRVSPENENHIFVLSDALLESSDAGKHFRRVSSSVHGDLHALWIDPKDPRRIWQGNDGGLAVTYDAGRHWEQVNNIALGQFYQVSTDQRHPFYNVTAGMQDNGTWTGPSRTREPAGSFNDDWRMVNPIVGFHSLSDPDHPELLLTEQPGGTLLLDNLETREQQVVSPQPQNFSGAPASQMKYRFNWDAPLVRSPFGKSTIYLAGNVIFQSSDYGRSWETISHDLTRNDQNRMGNVGGPISIDNSASEVYSTISALAESPAKRGVIWAGTDDGNLQVTTNGGGAWTNLTAKLPGVPPASPVSHIEPSVSDEKTAYVSLDRHMFDDFRPYLFKTTDGGGTWVSIASNLPSKAFLWTVREDPRRPGLLYAGTELGIYALWPDSSRWLPLHLANMPWSVAVRDIIFEPAHNDIVIATHGRSLFALDDATPLQQLADAAGKPVTLFPIRPALRFKERATRYGFGDKTFTAPNPPYGSLITYYLSADAENAQIQILDEKGTIIRTLPAPAKKGLNRIAWNLRYAAPRVGPQAVPGRYTARLLVGGQSVEKPFNIELDPGVQTSTEDLKVQFDMETSLLQMQTAVAAALKKLDTLKQKYPEQTSRLSQLLARPVNAGRSAAPPQLRENLDALFSMVDGVDAAPTAAQTSYFRQLQTRYRELSAQVAALQ